MDTKIHKLLQILLLSSGLFSGLDAAKILLMPLSHAAHVNFFAVAGETLHEAGHDVYTVVPKRYKKLVESYNIKPLLPNITDADYPVGELILKRENDPRVFIPKILKFVKSRLKETLEDKVFMNKLKDKDFDLILMDGFDTGRYRYIIPYLLSVPYISITVRPDPWKFRVPSMPSVEGVLPFTIMSENSNIFHRIMNVVAMLTSALLLPPSPFSVIDDHVITELLPEKENIGFAKLYHRSEIILVNMDIICLDFHRVSSPYYQFVGGIGARDSKTLSPELNDIMNNSPDGVIILTFGSAVKQLPEDMLNKMLEAFKDVKQNVIMRHIPEDHTDIPSNVYMFPWIPQNDLLGQKNAKLFITHAGTSGQLEAVYHGVPMLMIPMFADQFYNTYRAELKGYGKGLDSYTFTSTELKEAIIELLYNVTYSDNIKKCSKILHKLPSPQSRVLFWVNHILEFGGSHLKPFYSEMPFWKYFMLDLFLCFVVTIVILVLMLQFCCKKCCLSKQKTHQKEE